MKNGTELMVHTTKPLVSEGIFSSSNSPSNCSALSPLSTAVTAI